mmetsp:Transcript_13949/g.33461  ORF Transcript_13949/g.33461 Transcript_13949/m.33461 type:complete len:138 (-) Transcript_13949:1988-2401(-)
MNLTLQIPRQHVLAQLLHAFPARAPSEEHSCALSLPDAQQPIHREVIQTQHPNIHSFEASIEKKPMHLLTRISVGSSFRYACRCLINRRLTPKEQHKDHNPPKQHTSMARNVFGQFDSPYVPDLIVMGAPSQRLAQQ